MKLPKVVGNYELLKLIGRGSSGEVYKSKNVKDDTFVAIKVVDLERSDIEHVNKEIVVMKNLQCDRLVKYLDSFVIKSTLYIVTELMERGSVLDLLKSEFPEGMPEKKVAKILREILLGLKYLHLSNLIHRDIKADNILINKNGKIKIGDFGVSKELWKNWDSKAKTFTGTLAWMAPEVIEETNGYCYSADIWSLGITAIELATGKAPYERFSPIKTMIVVLQNPPPVLDQKFSKKFRDFITRCLKKEPDKRATVCELLDSPFLREGFIFDRKFKKFGLFKKFKD